jgi:hypothetical protein
LDENISTCFYRKFRDKEEAKVKEPVDVVVISKKDGFIWVEKKDYFPRDLNPGFIS